MRWIFIFLVFLNLFFYIWQHQQTEQNIVIMNEEDTQTDAASTLKLVSEQPIMPAKKSDSSPPVSSDIEKPLAKEITDLVIQKMPPQSSSQMTCLYFGGVTNKDQLAVFMPYLTTIDKTLIPDEIELQESPKFHLYLGATSETQRLSILDKLKALSINSLLSSKQGDNHRISLGIFFSEDDFSKITQQLNNAQLTPEIEPLKKAATSYWLKIPKEKQAIFTPELLNDLTHKLPTMQQELMLCDMLAH